MKGRGRLISVTAKIEPEVLDPHGNVGEGEAEFLEALESNNAGWDSLLLEASFALPGSSASHKMYESLGGVSTMDRTEEERRQARDYIKHEFKNLADELAIRLHKEHGISERSTRRLAREAAEEAVGSYQGTGVARFEEGRVVSKDSPFRE